MTARAVFLAVPTYNGIAPDSPTMRMILRWQERLRARGGALSFAPLKGCSVIGRARAELVTWFLNSRECYARMFGEHGTAKSATQDVRDFDPDNVDKHDAFVWLDDDVTLEREDGLDRMLALFDHGADIVSAPAMQRGNNRENFMRTSEPYALGPERVVDCLVTGFGCVAIRREVIERMVAKYDDSLRCRSIAFPGLKTWAMFNSIIVQDNPNDPEDRWMLDDDYAWSQLAREAGFKIHAAIDIATDHRGLRCAVGEVYDEKVTREGGRLVLAG